MRSFQNKKGVSLIAVLLFMLVATIAATATFKWLSSSNSSSGSRMAQQEAYQSSLAGLENARTWMTYHANDVGSLIKQYKDANKGKSATDAPVMIKLNNQLKSLTRSGQEYDVWLAGVNTEESTYKLKILSTGKARNGSVYSQVGIFNVDGLYQVKKPVKKEESSGKLDFSYAYFGGSYVGSGDVHMTSGMINGDWSGSPQEISENFVITGSISVTGNSFKANNVCIGGDLDIGNGDGLTATNIYLAGDTKNKYGEKSLGASVSGDFYVGGTLKAKKIFQVDGNMTVAGTFKTGSELNASVTIGKNLCVEDNGHLDLNDNSASNRGFEVASDVWISNPNGVTNSKSSATRLGKSSKSLVYVEGAVGSGTSYTQGSTGSFSTSATSGYFSASMPSYDKPQCAQTIKDECNSLWKEESHCGTPYKIDDPIVTAYKKFEAYANKGCDGVNSWNPTAISNCYAKNVSDEEKAKTNLYNGYQVIKITQTLNNKETCKSGEFKGKFIIIVEDQISCQENLTRVSPYGSDENGFVFLYLKKGAADLGGTINNYFIYSEAKINQSLQLNLNGTLYIPSDVCGGIGQINSSNLQHNQKLLDDMAKAAIVCNNDGTTCGGGSSDPGSGSEETAGEMLYLQNDSYYVANAPQLSVSLETQYKSNESAPTGADASTDLKEDFIVLPRVIYLTTNPYGKLEDYYNVIPLNGLKEEDLDGSVSCGNSDLLKNPIYDRTSSSATPLPSGAPIVCNYTASVNGQSQTVPFYIVVTGSSESGPVVSFTEAYKAMAKNGSYTVNVNVPAHDGNFTLKVSAPESDEQWTISGGTCSNGECTFTIGSDQDGVVPLFNVTSKADKGTANFQLLAGEGYSVGSPGIISLSVNTSVTINRTDVDPATLSAYCTNNSGDCPTRSTDWPNCSVADGVSWVRADNGVEGNNCTQATANEEWYCPTAASIKLTSITEGNDCIVIIPENEFIELSTLTTGESYTLHASAKARPLTFTFGFAGKDYASEKLIASIDGKTISKECKGTDGECTLEVFEGEIVSLTVAGDSRPKNFNYWSCSGTNCPDVRPFTGKDYEHINISDGTNKFYAHFGEKDKHCFFDEFELTSSDCSGSTPEEYCIGTNGKKWKVENSSYLDKLDYKDGSISVKPNKMDKAGVTIMSTAVAGFEGTMKAQFQVPRVVDEIPETVKKSGIILRSDEYGNNYLLLNIYADNEGALTARLCKKDGSGCVTEIFESSDGKLEIGNSEAIVTLTADITPKNGAVTLDLSAVANADRFTSTSTSPRTVSFNLTERFSDYQTSGEYLGFRLADPGFRLFDIGWYSKDYEANCWDTPPTVSCSFKAAYPSGIVPISSPEHLYAKPWVGLSSWYDVAGCEVSYLYKGADACDGNSSSYVDCGSDGYNFSSDGQHGIVNSTDDKDTSLAARAGVQNCSNLGEKDSYMEALEEKAFCGSFWVGKMEECKAGIEYASKEEKDGAKIYKTANETENLRMTTLTIELQNSDNAEIEVYLISQDYDGTGEFTSKSFVTKANTVINVPVEDIQDADGFNPEMVSSVAIVIPGGASVTIQKVYTTCPNEVSLSCDKNLNYNASSGAWEFSVRVNNYQKLQSLETWMIKDDELSTEGLISKADGSANWNCENSEGTGSSCSPQVTTGKTATYSFSISDSPYNDPKDYAFVVKLTDADGITYTSNSKYGCATNVKNISAITSTCSISEDSKFSTGGLPTFTYSVPNCPYCSYKIMLMKGSETLATIKEVSATTTPSFEANPEGNISVTSSNSENHENSADHALAAGKGYKFRIENANENMPFEACEKAFEIKAVTEASASECKIVDGVFSAKITGQNYGTGTVTIVYGDKLGNVLKSENIAVNTNTTFEYDLSSDEHFASVDKYVIGLLINGKQPESGECSETHDYEVKEPLAFTNCPASGTKLNGTSTTLNVTGCGTGETCTVSTDPLINTALNNGVISVSGATAGNSYAVTVTRSSDHKTATCPITFKSEGPDQSDITAEKCYFTSGGLEVATIYAGNVNDFKLNVTNPSQRIESKVKGMCRWESNTVVDGECAGSFWLEMNQTKEQGINAPQIGSFDGITYTIYVLDKSGKVICAPQLIVKSPLKCEATKTSVAPGEQFIMSAEYSGSGGSAQFSVNNSGWVSSSYTDFKQTFTASSTPGTYTYCAHASGTPSGKCCIDVTVAETDPPTMTCPHPTVYNVEPTAEVSFAPDGLQHCGAGCKYTIERSGYGTTKSSSNGNYSYKGGTIKFNSDNLSAGDSYLFTVENTIGSASCSFDVNYIKPLVSCPAVDKKGLSKSFTYAPTFNAGCSKVSCSYTLEGGSSTLSNSIKSGESITMPGESTANTKHYTLTVTDRANQIDTCQFDVEYAASAVIEVAFVYNSNKVDFEPGKEYVITSCSGGGQKLICGADGGGKDLYVNDSKVWSSISWQTLDNLQEAGGYCRAGNKITVEGGKMRCQNNW